MQYNEIIKSQVMQLSDWNDILAFKQP